MNKNGSFIDERHRPTLIRLAYRKQLASALPKGIVNRQILMQCLHFPNVKSGEVYEMKQYAKPAADLTNVLKIHF